MVYFIHKKKVIRECASKDSTKNALDIYENYTKKDVGILVDKGSEKICYLDNYKINYSQDFVDIVNNYKINKRLKKLAKTCQNILKK